MKKASKEKDLARLGKLVSDITEMQISSTSKLLSLSFIRGIAYGLGAALGGTIVLGILVWTLSQFNQLPLIGPLVKNVNSAIQQNKAQ